MRIFLIALICLFALPAQSDPKAPQQKATNPQQTAPTDQRGTEQLPAVVKILPAPKTREEAEADSKERAEKSETDWWLIKLTGALAIVGALQLIVFGVQARRLRQTVEAAAQQSDDMEKSIAESARAASAMEAMAKNMTESVATVKDVSARQMRAYVSVVVGIAIYQEKDRNLKFEARPIIINTGHTPAHDLGFQATAGVMPNPFPDDFAFPIPEQRLGAAMLGPQQNFVMKVIATDFVDEAEVPAIKAGDGKSLCVWGLVTYTDAFGVERETRFSQVLAWLKDGSLAGHYTQQHNTAT
jgi:hypothetical protein